MKKISIIIVLLLIFPLIVHAETITYNVCESGCEYSSIYNVRDNINSFENLSDKDIVININSDFYENFKLKVTNNIIKSLTINGNNHTINNLNTYAKRIEINNLTMANDKAAEFINPEKVFVNNSNIASLGFIFVDNDQLNEQEYNLNEIIEIDDESFGNVKLFGLVGNLKIENMDFRNKLVEALGGTQNFYNSQFGKILNVPKLSEEMNIYNSTFDSLKYKNITSYTEAESELPISDSEDFSYDVLHYDIYDLNLSEDNFNSNTTVYFDKNIEIKSNESINLTSYLDYYTNDKEINHIIEDEKVAKIEGLTLTGLKEGQTNITITTDDGHIVYRIKLNVIKEIEIPLSGINIKTSALIIGIVLLGVIGVCIYLLIRNKKVKAKK